MLNIKDNNNIVINTFVAGDYKSATEIFSESKMSEQDRQQSKIFLNDLWKNWLKEVGNNRLSIDVDINFFINNFNELDPSLSAAEKAKKYGLVDKILTRIELRKYFYELANKDENNIIKEPKTVSLKSYYDGKKESNFSKDKIIVLNAYGEIIDGSFQDNQISSEFFSKKLNEISKDPSVKGLLLRINSPGGSGFASEVIRQELLNLKNSGVPIVVSISDIAASGGYWISANADEIWATPLSVTGSIGVFALLPSIEDALSKFGFNYDGLSTTDFNPSIVSSPNENLKSFIQNYVDRAYSDFINLVSEGRNLNIDSVNEISNGKIWTGTQALENGLIDNIGTQSEAIERLKEIIGYEEIDVEYLNFKQSFFDFLGDNFLNFRTLNKFFNIEDLQNLHGFLVVAILVGILYYWLVWKTTLGFDLRITGSNPIAAKFSGINPKRLIVIAMVVSGAFAGLVGLAPLLGYFHRYTIDFPTGLGFAGIGVALLGRNHPFGMAVGALLFAFLQRSAQILDLNDVPKEIEKMMQAFILLIVVVFYEVIRRFIVKQQIKDASKRTDE